MKTTNIFKGTSLLSKKQIKVEKSATKKAVNESLRNYESNINAAYNILTKDTDIRVRNLCNAAKGRYKTALEVVASCYPYQTANGVLCSRKKNDDGVKVWSEKRLTAAAARGIVRDALKHFTDTLGSPSPQVVVIGEAVK